MNFTYLIVIVAVVALIWWLYKRAVYDFTRGYREGLKDGDQLQRTKKNSSDQD